jgi:tetratricopeptide (TPR) repeat protein
MTMLRSFPGRELAMKRIGFVPVLAASLACALVSPVARAAGPDATETAEQLAEQGYAQQAAGKYAEAVSTYLKAYDLSKDALTLLNIATIYDRKLNQHLLASEYYRRYVMAPDAEPDRVKRVTERLTALKQEEDKIAEEERERARAAAAAPPPTTQPAQPSTAPSGDQTGAQVAAADDGSRGAPLRAAGIIVGVLGVAGLGTSFALGYVAKTKNDSANALCNGSACPSEAGVSLAQTAGTYATASTAAFVAGLALVGGGIVLYAVAPRGAPASRTAGIFVAPSVDRTGGGVALYGAF